MVVLLPCLPGTSPGNIFTKRNPSKRNQPKTLEVQSESGVRESQKQWPLGVCPPRGQRLDRQPEECNEREVTHIDEEGGGDEQDPDVPEGEKWAHTPGQGTRRRSASLLAQEDDN